MTDVLIAGPVAFTAKYAEVPPPGDVLVAGPVAFSVKYAEPEFEGTITRKVLEYDETRANIPVSKVYLGQKGLVHIWGRNDMDALQYIGIHWVVKDPDGMLVEDYLDWKGWPLPMKLSPGAEHEFIGDRFNIDKEGTYTLKVDLLMNTTDDPVIVNSYEGALCFTAPEVPPVPPPGDVLVAGPVAFTVKYEEIPPEYELIQHTIYHFAYIYDGDVEITTATFKTDPFTPSAWMGEEFTNKLEEEVRAKGAHVLEVKVYVDTTPLLWTDFRVELIATPLGEAVEATPGIAAIPIAVTILIIALAIVMVIVWLTLAFTIIWDRIHPKPGLETVKVAWGKEALILDIQDAEEYWERPPIPVETLEGMSEEELRDHLDEIAEEEVPPAKFPFWGWVVVGGGALALAIAARKKIKKPEKKIKKPEKKIKKT